MQKTIQQRSIRDSIERVDEYIRQKQGFVVVTQIANELHLQVSSIRKCAETLQKLNRVDIATNGHIMLVKVKEVENATRD